MTDLSKLAASLSSAQRHFVLMSSETPIHPYDIDANGLTAAAMVRRGIAFRTVCRMTATDEAFNGYGLTGAGLQLRRYLQEMDRG